MCMTYSLKEIKILNCNLSFKLVELVHLVQFPEGDPEILVLIPIQKSRRGCDLQASSIMQHEKVGKICYSHKCKRLCGYLNRNA